MVRKKSVNTVELKDGIIYYKQIGDQTREQAINSMHAIDLLVRDISKVLIFADYQDSGKMDADALKSGWYAFRNLEFHKAAFYGTTPYLTELLNSMIRVTGKGKKIRFVKNPEEAIKWLKE